MKKILYILLACVAIPSFSQEMRLSPSSQYLADNPYVVAPAFAGIGTYFQLRGSAAFQWVGVKDAPQTQTLSFDARVASKSAIGIVLYNDKNRNTYQKGGQITYAHHLILDEYSDQYLSFGLSYKFNSFNIDVANLANASADPAIANYKSTLNSNFDVGLLYRYKKAFISFNVVNILDKKVEVPAINEPVKLRNYYLYTGYVFKNEFQEYEIEPSLFYQLFESDKRSGLDANLKFKKFYGSNFLWAGLSVRLLGDQSFKPNAVIPMLGFKKDIFYLGYSYSYGLSGLELNQSGTHVITLGLDFKGRRNDCKCTY
ncbi:hypothetical protein IA01_03465 [Flavobacterium psychrophilum]|uniref:Type IX secretion system membrane protein PorP/SprF n=3 Tax=Flavobacterium psychrophilum TaxID=96345 RepID=A6GXH0_FLAPJ|nr:type IX secretion system membrane protein PorP/SprF [Flavobacterium psychrophilum]AIG29587.1 hypothetical protein IA03_03450 [Flavobacterium psychrophilum]AIG31864.1 hypothetical protein IA01_03465 [Flavobacterium psychrophilum]AIG34018.1 hypothetical protein IA02_02855 [Flavobacterium psychrophilum]AIG36382.1 hypothetical protein IA04_03365 [Flavobacterium psychrophilum]AIG38647.1 hypothetical protein IA05_03450 [Flavobacterium psychrophilum]